jgi:hypothetical protein
MSTVEHALGVSERWVRGRMMQSEEENVGLPIKETRKVEPADQRAWDWKSILHVCSVPPNFMCQKLNLQ